VVLIALASVLVAAGCAGRAESRSASPPARPVEMRVLATSAVPGIPSKTTRLSLGSLAADASIPGIASTIASFGYREGRERTFQGESRSLTLVVSRSLVFGDAAGARRYLAFVHANALPYFGAGVDVHPLMSHGRAGWEFVPPACACHEAAPAYVGVLPEGSEVTWLEINGPEATKRLLLRLLAPRRSEAVA